MANKKLLITEVLENIYCDEIYLDYILIELQQYKEKYCDKYSSLIIGFSDSIDGYDDENNSIVLYGEREETDRECEIRINRENKRKAKEENRKTEKERKLYEQLKKKFE